MPLHISTAKIVADAERILNVWSAHRDFTMRDVTLEQVHHDHAALIGVLAELKRTQDEITPLRHRRDVLVARIHVACKRARSGIRGYFGEDSSEYELVGGTRTSERKRSGRSAKGAGTAET